MLSKIQNSEYSLIDKSIQDQSDFLGKQSREASVYGPSASLYISKLKILLMGDLNDGVLLEVARKLIQKGITKLTIAFVANSEDKVLSPLYSSIFQPQLDQMNCKQEQIGFI